MRTLKNFWRKHFQSERKLATEERKEYIMETEQMYFTLLVNMRKLKNISKKHLQSARKLVTEKKKEQFVET